MTLYILIGITLIGLIVSILRSRPRTLKSMKMSLKMGKGMGLELLSLLALIALILAYLPEKQIAKYLGDSSGLLASVYGAVIGSVTILPGVIAFPLAKQLVVSGASLAAIAAFITTLTMVGLATSPLEKRYFGLRYTVLRNSISFIFAISIALIMGVIL